ncbi:MAG: PD-(D/E)XK nuclease family protein, partial [Flavobacteriaceae bacterium]|nr:PD-(D/E)XK nuclease family protein [Flavobacteriaceae bacterium]
IKELNHWSKNLEKSKNVSEYLQFWRRLKTYYFEFKQVLSQMGKGYPGMVYKEAAQEITHYSDSLTPGISHIFVGFNALNPAEEQIIQHLLIEGKALVYWDIDSHYLDNQWHDAGHFIREYKDNWNYYNSHDFKFVTTHYTSEKSIRATGTPNNLGQVKYTGNLIQKLRDKNESLDDTAIVLGDEELLLPLLNSLPSEVGPINVTMGLKLEYTPLADLFSLLFKIHKKQSKEFYYKDVLNLINHPFLRYYFQSESSSTDISTLINQNNVIYLSLNWLNEKAPEYSEQLRYLFEPWENVQTALTNCQRIILAIKEHLDSNRQRHKLTLEYLFRFHVLFNKLKLYAEKYSGFTNISSLAIVYRSLLKQESLDFQGEPLQGLQIMGMLETRLLDFKNVIILSVNEGVLPGGKTDNSFIPFDVKRENKLPTYMEMDAIFTYHFHRLIQRAKNVDLIYNSEPDALQGGEKSRFIAQIEYDGFHDIIHQTTAVATPPYSKKIKTIPKTDSLLEKLKAIAANGFSPSSLTNYIRNPLDFYLEKVLEINDFDKVEETVAHNTLGTVIHNVLEILYTPFINKKLSEDGLKEMLVKVPRLVKNSFEREYQGGNLNQGKNLIVFEVCKRYITNYIEKEISLVKSGNDIIILGLEKQIKTQLPLPELDFPVFLKGTIDRLDVYNGTKRIIDYKTGNVNSSDLTICDWEDLNTDYKRYSKCFQILSYAYLLNSHEPIERIEGGIISLKNLQDNPFMKFGIKESTRSRSQDNDITPDTLKSFQTQLKKLILEIFNPELDFIEKEVN